MSNVRVRFAPSPTGGLHLGGVRTALYNYLFAKNMGGKFIVRIEDTDQTRFVDGAEKYIFDCLKWCGIEPDESPMHGGNFGPYKQSERKNLGIYKNYADKLIKDGFAYYAFDTPEELEKMRLQFKSDENPLPQYDSSIRLKMKNSLTLNEAEVNNLLASGCKYVIRIKMPENEMISFFDMIRGEIKNDTTLIDDKVLLKADGMPTYHLAVVVDDYLMKITHAFRGEEWLPSAPVHVLLWKYLFGLELMPKWAHLPLILGPNGKLSKRDGSKYGFPVFAMNWVDAKTNELTEGFKEKGFLPQTFINLLALLGWNDGTEQELFSKDELIAKFNIDRVHSGGAKFDYEKAIWFNAEWIKKLPIEVYINLIRDDFKIKQIDILDDQYFTKVIDLIKDRCTLITDFTEQGNFFFKTPITIDTLAIKQKWNELKKDFFIDFIKKINDLDIVDAVHWENIFKDLATEKNIKPGELQLPFRIMLVGGKFGPPVFLIAFMIGKDETINRINTALQLLD